MWLQWLERIIFVVALVVRDLERIVYVVASEVRDLKRIVLWLQWLDT